MNTRRRLQGVVSSNKMAKTVTVSRMKAHDELNCQVGDSVEILESKPISRTKRWVVKKIISRQKAQDELPVELPVGNEG
jgi:small subunit ribosomal protein S17